MHQQPTMDMENVKIVSSNIVFCRAWKDFKYPSRTMRFASQNKSKEGQDIIDQITLPQFSSAIVPKV